jgi:hypothetical protein
LGNTLVSGWSVDSILTLQDGFPFTAQLSYNPSNNGDTRNPVRPFVNPNFDGNAILGCASPKSKTRSLYASAFCSHGRRDGFDPSLGTRL